VEADAAGTRTASPYDMGNMLALGQGVPRGSNAAGDTGTVGYTSTADLQVAAEALGTARMRQ